MPALQLDVELRHPPDRVWRALTEGRPLNEWFQPLTGWPDTGATEGTVGRVFPGGELHSFNPFDIELLQLRAPGYLLFQWRGDDFLSEVTFELAPSGQGCRLRLRQTGFLGTDEAWRRAELFDGYQLMLAHRLPAALDRLAGIPPRSAAPPRPAPPRPTARRAPVPQETRMRMLSLTGAATIVVLCASAATVWLTSNTLVPATGADVRGMGSGRQPGVTLPSTSSMPPTAAPSTRPTTPGPASTTSQAAAAAKATLIARYNTITLLGLGGFDTEVTVSNPGGQTYDGWTVVLTMPGRSEVQNRSPDLVNMVQNGQKVTITPIDPHLPRQAPVTFVVRYPALLALGGAISSCTIDGRPCS